jgi:glycerophosphoryl diester phosphodiesterase
MQAVTNESLGVSLVARSAWRDFLAARRSLFIFDFLFKLVEAWVLVPAVALVLAIILSQAGHVAVSNLDIVGFLLTPLGILYVALFGTVAVGLVLFEQAGIMVLAATVATGQRPLAVFAAFPNPLRVVQLGMVMGALLVVTLAPFALLAVLTYVLLLSEHDLYYYLTDRPPVFWVAASIGGCLGLGALTAGLWLCVRWALALPILLFEKYSARAALRASRERVRGVAWVVTSNLLGWSVGAVLLGVVLEVGFRLIAATILEYGGPRPIVLILLLLLAQGVLVATWSFIIVVGLGLMVRRLYLLRNEQLGLERPDSSATAGGPERAVPPWDWRVALLSIPLLLLAPLALWVEMARYLTERPPVQVTAHRGHSLAAPENTLSAVRKAIDSGADYAEVDVQQTADGVVVVLHDSDLKRVAGVPRRVAELTHDEVRKLDVGSWFGPAFAGERVPTLAEVIDLARGRIKLNIELKFYGPDRRLAVETARLIGEKGFEADCLVTSFALDALQQVKQHDPRIRTGLIVGKTLGDASRLGVDALSVRADGLSDEMLHGAHRRGQEVHVWTVNDAPRMNRLIKRGVDNVITDDPDLAIRVRDQWTGLTGSERLVLSGRLLLGLEP